jgi:lysophospholipid acyltransferase (LPLAT)-like uncharacterized protein
MLPNLTSLLLRALAATWRFSVQGKYPQTPAVLAFWHDEMLAVWKLCAKRQQFPHCTALVSKSSDGALLAQLLADWRYDIVRGSSSQGSNDALEQLIKAGQTSLVCITPDGPRGERHVMKKGAIVIAAKARVPLILCRVRAEGKRFTRSWDKFLLPKPFARITIIFSEAVHVPHEISPSQMETMLRDGEKMLEEIY